MSESKFEVAILMGSSSDLELMKQAMEILDEFGVSYDVRVSSAHRALEETIEYVKSATNQGVKVFIAGAGGAAHLPGVVAASTIRPVIGVPISSSALAGIDSLMSIVQMPAGIPVGTVTVGQTGALNAAILAVEILSIYDNALAQKLIEYRAKLKQKVKEGNISIRKKYGLE